MLKISLKNSFFTVLLLSQVAFGEERPKACDQKFLNTLSANFYGLGCARKILTSCQIRLQFDNRTIDRNHSEPLLPTLLTSREIESAINGITTLSSFVSLTLNPLAIGAKAFFFGLGQHSPCLGQRYYRDEQGIERSVDYWENDPYVRKQAAPNTCKVDPRIEKNKEVASFFKLSQNEQLRVLKKDSICTYYRMVNDLVRAKLIEGPDAVKFNER